ncbi:MAG: hypothetical protein KDB07_11850, partial [Planctomycetes bacterium]|nr:hypothetical protein [Planctomycetota bacterium]
FEQVINELEHDFFSNGLFPNGYRGFDSSVFWRDGSYVAGAAAVELARLERSKSELDVNTFRKWLAKASRYFGDINAKFSEPINREIYDLMLNEDKSFDEALELAGRGASAPFEDEIFYNAFFYSAEVEWLRAIHVDPANALSDDVLDALQRAQGILEGLSVKLKPVERRQRLVGGDSLTFPDMARLTRYRYADTVYLRARTLRDRELSNFRSTADEQIRLDPTATPVFQMSRDTHDLYLLAERSYNEAEKFDDQTYLAVFARVQRLNIYRAMAQGGPVKERAAYSQRAETLLNRSDTTLTAMPDEAFANAPEGMRRSDWEQYFSWYRNFDSLNPSSAGS